MCVRRGGGVEHRPSQALLLHAVLPRPRARLLPGPAPPPQEMEAAAVAWSADLFGCPVFCIKSVTDIVDGERPAQVRRCTSWLHP